MGTPCGKLHTGQISQFEFLVAMPLSSGKKRENVSDDSQELAGLFRGKALSKNRIHEL
jgi:hypothetical protein